MWGYWKTKPESRIFLGMTFCPRRRRCSPISPKRSRTTGADMGTKAGLLSDCAN